MPIPTYIKGILHGNHSGRINMWLIMIFMEQMAEQFRVECNLLCKWYFSRQYF